MHITAALIFAVVVLGQYDPAVAKLRQHREPFKQSMMPHVGKVVAVTGKLSFGKISDFVWTEDPGAVYVRAINSADIEKAVNLSRQMLGKRIVVTGKLQFDEGVVPKNPDGSVRTDLARIPEHFYIDIAEARIRTAGHER